MSDETPPRFSKAFAVLTRFLEQEKGGKTENDRTE